MNKDTLWLNVPAAMKLTLANTKTTIDFKKEKITLFVANHGMVPELRKNIHYIELTINKFSEKYNNIELINFGSEINDKYQDEIINLKIGNATAHFCHAPAMSNEQLSKAVNAGRQAAQRAKLKNTQLFIAKGIGAGNNLSTAAIACALFDVSSKNLTQKNIIVNNGIPYNSTLIQSALNYHKGHLHSVLEILRCLGGFEIAALVGSYLSCAHMGINILIDDFNSTVAAQITSQLCPHANQWFVFLNKKPTIKRTPRVDILNNLVRNEFHPKKYYNH